MSWELTLLFVTGLIAGAIDSIAGGGGLINLPALMAVVGPGPTAIGTNKIAGTLAAAVAWWVYARHARRTRPASERQLASRTLLLFCAGIGLGSFTGSGLAPFFPTRVFPILLLTTAPLLLWLVWKKDLWIQAERVRRAALHPAAIFFSGLGVGFYDGAWGPGGGTLMLLALLFIAERPLWEALLVSKIANTLSASVAGAHYWSGGYVQLAPGIAIGVGSALGAWIGSRFASRNAARAVRPTLALVSTLLTARALWGVAHS